MHNPPLNAAPCGSRANALEVLLLYATKAEGRRAVHLLESLKRRLGPAARLNIQLWRVDLLEDPEWRSFIAPEAGRANLLLVAANEAPPPGRELQVWLRRLLRRKRGSGVAVAMLPPAARPGGPPPPWYRFLWATTTAADIKFVGRLTPVSQVDPGAAAQRNRRAHVVSETPGSPPARGTRFGRVATGRGTPAAGRPHHRIQLQFPDSRAYLVPTVKPHTKSHGPGPVRKASPARKAVGGRGVPPVKPAPLARSRTVRSDRGLPVVGIGASAGGLEALEEFFKHTPSDSGIAFVVITHQHPKHHSLLPELLGRCTRLPTVEAREGLRVEADRIYLSPPGAYLTITKGVLHLNRFKAQDRLRRPIDFFFRALAEDRRERAIGIVLSGTGTDGTLGLTAIKEATGMGMAQDPQSARYSGMPASAIDSGLVDYILPPARLPRQLLHYVQGPYLTPMAGGPAADAALPEAMQQILLLLRSRVGHDFADYKPGTIRRRIERRMNVHQIEGPRRYLQHLRDHPHELDLLFKELLIGVTGFFRDAGAFEALARKALPELLRAKPDDSPVRVWVPGCSTGEEAYSLALVLVECLEQLGKRLPVQIFATDLDNEAIHQARLGVYPDGIAAEVSRQRLKRFFVKDGATYRIRKEIRDLVVFAPQNVAKDPPFTRLDLLSCRNLLIYLEAEMQQRLLNLFHYALKPRGLLFLGLSESLGRDSSQHFDPLDKRWKIFARKGEAAPPPALAKSPAAPPEGPARGRAAEPAAVASGREPSLAPPLERLLLNRFAPATVVVDERGDICYIHGRTGEFLEPATGQPRLNVLEMAREGLRVQLGSALRRAAAQAQEVVRDGVRVKTNGGYSLVRLSVCRITEPESLRGLLIVTFRRESAAEPVRPRPAGRRKPQAVVPREQELERELSATRESLQSAIEELEASNEELKSANEELQSTNEELQSTNEELETSKEEMQSLNEEMQTVNAQLTGKLEELSQANDDMQNLLNSTDIATLFLDRDCRIKRFTEQVRAFMNLIPSDVGRPVVDLVSRLNYSEFMTDAAEVLRTLASREREVQTRDGDWRLVRLHPYRTTHHVIDGLVITFIDINRVKRAEQAAQQARHFEASVIATVREPMLVLDDQLRVIMASRSFYRFFDLQPGEVEQVRVFDLAGHAWNIPALRQLLDDILDRDGAFEDFEFAHEFPRIGRRVLRLNARRLEQESRLPEMVLLAMEDVTDRRDKLELKSEAPAGMP